MADRYQEAEDLQEAMQLLATNRGAAIVAGGTDLVVGARSGKKPLPDRLIGIHRLTELQRIEEHDEGLRLGALVSHAALEADSRVMEKYSALSDASTLVGSPATRFTGTVGGNICNASPAMEVGSPFLVFMANVELRSTAGSRNMPFAEFVQGPGRTARRPDEILTSILLPALPDGGRQGSGYSRLEFRQAMEIAVVGAAALVVMDAEGRCTLARLALTAVAPTCIRVTSAEEALVGRRIDAERIAAAGRLAASSAAPIDDVRGSAEYRRAMVPVMVRRALDLAMRRARRPAEAGLGVPV
jgi:CO/xanthine dehydrogenase FAD-binding subunit